MERIFLFFFPILVALTSCNFNSKSPQSISDLDSLDATQQKIIWHWDDEFNPLEKEKMMNWITYVSDCAQLVLGRYPFDINYHFHREDGADHAVVFGHTGRTLTSHGAHFYVNPIYPIEDFMADWIAPHEISHLALPKLSKPNMWFYEGFATYISRKVMIEMGTITPAEADSTAYARIGQIKSDFESTSNFVFVADSLLGHYRYSSLYWGGGSYFHKIDRKLDAENKTSLVNVLKYFQLWAHQPDLNLDAVITAFDKISQSTIFSDFYKDYTTLPAQGILVEY